MRTIITLDGKKISKKAACEQFGKEDMERKIKEQSRFLGKTPG